MDSIDEILENPAFYMLAGLGLGAEILGWIMSKKMAEYSFPFWQLAILMVGTVVAAAFFVGRE